ncbi:MAG: YceI family protein [Candidatus Omnitrophota bacterium]|nr:YceI family protein [Candidatus Omnitrophota bacterium]
MRVIASYLGLILAMILCGMPLASAQVAEHFYNPPENINPDPDYAPGDYALPELYAARVTYQILKAQLTEAAAASAAPVTLGLGEITFSSAKNESATVLGYFRNYFGALNLGAEGLESMNLVIDVNSLDTGVPGRNNRILAIFFESMKPELGVATVRFDSFDLGGKTLGTWQDGQAGVVKAGGVLTMNAVVREISAELNVTRQGGTWVVESASPLKLMISDYEFGNRPYDLMKECNHKALGNAVEVNVKLYLR